MFTGLIEAVGVVLEARKLGAEMDLRVDLGSAHSGVGIGDSVALSGVCCTVTALHASEATFFLSEETLRRTWFDRLAAGVRVNVERCLRAGQPLGGHIVQGHVDGLGKVVSAIDGRVGGQFEVAMPPSLGRYCVDKGSIALDGVSLTIAGLTVDGVQVAVIPHTAQQTTLGRLRVGDPINIEVDMFAKYIERFLEARFGPTPPG